MPSANLIFRRTFDGAGYPDFAIEWGGFDFTPSGTINKAGWSRPVVNGYGMGMPSRTIGGVTWRARATTMPGTSDYQVDLRGLWKNPAGDGRREIGIIVRMLDVDNCVVARLRSMGSSSPELRLFKIIGGTETQLGSTYTGVSAGAMATSTKWRVRVQDLPSGDTRVTVAPRLRSSMPANGTGPMACSSTTLRPASGRSEAGEASVFMTAVPVRMTGSRV